MMIFVDDIAYDDERKTIPYDPVARFLLGRGYSGKAGEDVAAWSFWHAALGGHFPVGLPGGLDSSGILPEKRRTGEPAP